MTSLELARGLAASYLRLGEPALAIGVVRSVSPELVTDPILTHRLAQAYEAVGRLDDAAATAAVARARCLRAIGSSDALATAAPARFDCSPSALVTLEQHEQALTQMLLLGRERSAPRPASASCARSRGTPRAHRQPGRLAGDPERGRALHGDRCADELSAPTLREVQGLHHRAIACTEHCSLGGKGGSVHRRIAVPDRVERR